MSIENQNWGNSGLNQAKPLDGAKQEIGHALDEKQYVSQMVSEIDNENLRSVLNHYFHEEKYSSEKIVKEIEIYYKEIEPRLSNEASEKFFNNLLKWKLLPSSISKEFIVRDEIFLEDSQIKEMMEISLENGVRPSVIMEWKDLYSQLVVVEDPTEKDLILRYLSEWYTPKSVYNEHEIYEEIMSYEYKDEDLKDFLLSLMKDENVNPSFIELYFNLFCDKECWEETKNYIRLLLNQPEK